MWIWGLETLQCLRQAQAPYRFFKNNMCLRQAQAPISPGDLAPHPFCLPQKKVSKENEKFCSYHGITPDTFRDKPSCRSIYVGDPGSGGVSILIVISSGVQNYWMGTTNCNIAFLFLDAALRAAITIAPDACRPGENRYINNPPHSYTHFRSIILCEAKIEWSS